MFCKFTMFQIIIKAISKQEKMFENKKKHESIIYEYLVGYPLYKGKLIYIIESN
jgi:hypothetical protein